MTNHFHNPWGNLGSVPGTFKRVQTNIPPSEWQYLRRLRVEQGTIVTTMNLLLKKLIDELKRQGITDYSHTSAFEHFVANSVLALPNGTTAGGPSPQTNAPDVRGGTAGRGDSHPQPANVTSSVPSSTILGGGNLAGRARGKSKAKGG